MRAGISRIARGDLPAGAPRASADPTHFQGSGPTFMTVAAISQGRRPPRVQRSFGTLAWADPLSWAAVAIGCLVIFDSPSFLGYVHADSLQLALETWDL